VLLALALLAVAGVPGERLEYSVRYGPVNLGTLVLETLEPETVGAETCQHFRAELQLTRSFSWLFWANYRLETWCRDSDLTTVRSYKRAREPNYRAEWTAEFDSKLSVARYSDRGPIPIEPGTRDLLSTWHYFRTLSLASGDTIRTQLHVDRRNYRLVAVARPARTLVTPAGIFDCVAVVPRAGGPLGVVHLGAQSRMGVRTTVADGNPLPQERWIPVSIRTRIGGLTVTALLSSVSHNVADRNPLPQESGNPLPREEK